MQSLLLVWPSLVERVDRGGLWSSWVTAEPALASAHGLDEVVLIVADRAHPQRADALLAALVRLGAVDGGNDHDAAVAVASLLANGSARLARQLRDLSPDIDEMVAGQVWLQIREFPWRRRRRCIAQNIMMDARRAVLRDLGVDTRLASRGVLVVPVDTTVEVPVIDSSSRHPVEFDYAVPVDDELTMAAVLKWATGNGLVDDQDAAILADLATVEVAGTVRGLNSWAELGVVGARRGLSERTVVRRRDRALQALIGVRERYVRECE